MKIHEYQAKELFRKYDIAVPEGSPVQEVKEAVTLSGNLGDFPQVVKAQIHAGGRGKGGGVRVVHTVEELECAVEQVFGMILVTHQTGPDGQLVKKLLVEAGQKIATELYLSLLVDRETDSVVIIASKEGGMDIEEVASRNPEKIIKVSVDPLAGLGSFQIRELCFGLELPPAAVKHFSKLIKNLYTLFVANDCSLVEINPLIVTPYNEVVAIDGKVSLDSNALFRHPELLGYRDLDEEDPLEVEASEHGLNYINLDGNVGNIVNGAGLAMATMDIIKLAGAEPANFMDVGGGATAEMVENGLRIILSDKKVKAVLINIFGGILRCDVFAEGIVKAAQAVELSIPIVVRMEGTNVVEGRLILDDSGLNLTSAEDLRDAATKIAASVAQ